MKRCTGAIPNVWLWTDWPEEYRDPRSPRGGGVRAGTSRRASCFSSSCSGRSTGSLPRRRRTRSRKGMRIGLYHDLALATDRYGADLWAHRPFIVAGCRVGAPPDDFAPNGQDWGFPAAQSRGASRGRLPAVRAIHPQQRAARRRAAHRSRDALLPSVLDSGRHDAAEGAYVRDYAEDLLGILALESVAREFMVVGRGSGHGHRRGAAARWPKPAS